MKRLIACGLIVLLAGCTTLKDAKEGRGTGVSRDYPAAFDVIWNATVKVVKESDLDLVSENRERGEILAQRGLSVFSYGENVALFVDRKSDSITTVEVISKRSLATNITARDWGETLLDRITESLP
ncbi:MAG: hypothetical protein AAF493_13285 [Pseudomonadota bacterium]